MRKKQRKKLSSGQYSRVSIIRPNVGTTNSVTEYTDYTITLQSHLLFYYKLKKRHGQEKTPEKKDTMIGDTEYLKRLSQLFSAAMNK